MLVPLRPDEIADHEVTIEVVIRRVPPAGGTHRFSRRITVPLARLVEARPAIGDKILASILEVVDTAIQGPVDA